MGAVCIGFSAIFTRWAGVPGSVSAFYRVVIATLVLAVPFAVQWLRQRGQAAAQPDVIEEEKAAGRYSPTRILVVTALTGLFFALDLATWNTALGITTAANATLLGNTSTLWVSLGALLFFHEMLKRRFWAGMAVALAGAAIVVGHDVWQHPSLSWGDVLSVISSLFYAGYLLGTGRVRRYIGTLSFMWISSAVAAILLLAYVLVTGQTLWGFSADTWRALFALGLVSHVLGWLSINYALGHLPAPLTAVSLLSQPVITAIAAVPLLGETLSPFQIGGGLLVLLGVYTVNRR